MLFHNTSPLGGQAQPRIFSQRFLAKHCKAICVAEWAMGFQNPVQALLVKGFEEPAPAWLAQAKPCVSLIIRANPGNRWFFPQ